MILLYLKDRNRAATEDGVHLIQRLAGIFAVVLPALVYVERRVTVERTTANGDVMVVQ